MKYKIHILFVVIIGLILFTSCGHEEETYIDEYKDEYSYGLQVFDMSMKMLPNATDEFSTNKDRIIKFYNLTDHVTDYIFFVTLNGSLCPIKVDGAEAGVSYSGSAEADSVTQMEVNIQLKGEQLLHESNFLVFTVITDNQIVPDHNVDMLFNKVSFANKLNIPDTTQVKTNTVTIYDADNYQKSDEIKERYGDYQFATLQDIETRRYEMISDRNIQFHSNQSKRVRIEAVGDEGMYSLLLFCNNNPIYLSKDKYDYIFRLEGHDMFSKEIELSSEDTEGTLYALIFPLASDNYMPFLTNKVKFVTD